MSTFHDYRRAKKRIDPQCLEDAAILITCVAAILILLMGAI